MSDDRKNFIGLTIAKVRKMSRTEAEAAGVDDDRRPNVLVLNNGTLIFALSDEEGNGWGTMIHGIPTVSGRDLVQSYI